MKSIDKYRKEIEGNMSRFLSEMIRIPSTSGKEGDLVRHIKMEMEKVGFDHVAIDEFGNVVGKIGTGSRLIAMDAHVDTVDVGNPDLWTFDPFCGDIRNGYVWGRGASDQEGGMASLVYAGYLIKTYDLLPRDVTLIVTGTVSEEDCDGLCWRYLIEKENLRPEMVLITEPTNCRLYRGQRGRMEISAKMPGISAHGSAPERGINAIVKMAYVIQNINDLASQLREDDFLGKGTLTLSQIRSTAPSLCSVADSCEIYIDRRLTWGETPEEALEQIRKSDPDKKLTVEIPIYDTPTHTGYQYKIEKSFPAWKTPENHHVVTSGVETYRCLFNMDPEIGRWTFSTNGVAISGMHGIPCIGFGPGKEEWAHAPDERVSIQQLIDAALFYAFYPKNYMAIES
ncbi:YgeY family selenium metabolism-linked hydrolase [bacterium]|nr:YgeY family selenium metabolism-linked hydrolase [candidate division CSSED10-310 bacterium]